MESVESGLNSKIQNFKIVLTTEFNREFFSKRTVVFLGVFMVFTGLIIFILQDNLISNDNPVAVTPIVWVLNLGNITVAFFGGLIGVAVSAYLGGQLLVKDLNNGPIRLLNTHPIDRGTFYFARVMNGVLIYFPISIISGFVVMTVGTLQGYNYLGESWSEFDEIYLKASLGVIVIIFIVGFLSISIANLVGIYTGNETQGVVLAVVVIAFGDLFVSILSALVPEWDLQFFSVGYHRTELLKYFLQADFIGSDGPLAQSSIAIPWVSISIMFGLPILLLTQGYHKFKSMDLD